MTIPYRFDRTATAGELHERHAELADGAETEEVASVAGRMLLRRVQGKVAFATLVDPTGRIQLFAGVQTTPRFEAFCSLSLGDWIGVTGTVMRTRRSSMRPATEATSSVSAPSASSAWRSWSSPAVAVRSNRYGITARS